MSSHLTTLLVVAGNLWYFVQATTNSTHTHDDCDSDECENADDGGDSSDSSHHHSSSGNGTSTMSGNSGSGGSGSRNSGSGGQSNPGQNHGLSKGAIAGIVIGAIFFALFLALFVWACWRRRRLSNAVYSKPLPSPPSAEQVDPNLTRQVSTAPPIPVPVFLQPPPPPTVTRMRNVSPDHSHSSLYTPSSHDMPVAESAPLLSVPPSSNTELSRSLSMMTTLPNPYDALYPDPNVAPTSTRRISTVSHSLASQPESTLSASTSHHSPVTLGASSIFIQEQDSVNDAEPTGEVLLGEMTRYQKHLEEHHRKESESAAAGSSAQLDPPPKYSVVNH